MIRYSKTITAVAALVAICAGLILAGNFATAQYDRRGAWHDRPEDEIGTAWFEHEWDKYEVEDVVVVPVSTPTPRPTMRPRPTSTPRPTATPEPEPRETKPPKPELDVPYENIYFDYDKSDLRPRAERILKDVANYLDHYPDIKVTIKGHTDAIGSHKYNDALSVRRAESARRYLIGTLGVAPDRIQIVGKGERIPAASNTNPQGRQKNRRVEFAFTKR